MYKSTYAHADSVNQLSDNFWRETSSSKAEESGEPLSLTSAANDLDMPTPPLALARVSQHGISTYNLIHVHDIAISNHSSQYASIPLKG
ncbi:hypothetical protein CK203_070274 [Vitis vinifera]|uniref:Uncharacterized protein n=1 Tax=Vitis vinifera TaxID=29760 RepID=A0A438E6E8_VITVI|nr:hypothetical protein CK203_070274 [Vitis vinifera]